MRTKAIAAAAAMMLIPVAAPAVELGDAGQGLEYAKQVCAECHGVEEGDLYSPNPDAPAFEDVANTPGMSARALNVWLHSSHPTMPNYILPDDVSDNVIAYIMSLRNP